MIGVGCLLYTSNVGVDTNVFLYGADVDFSVEANFSDNRDTVGQAGGYSCLLYTSRLMIAGVRAIIPENEARQKVPVRAGVETPDVA